MANHKWKALPENIFNLKAQECVKCGVYREWQGGDFQCWNYKEWYSDGSGYENKYKRPDCI